MSARCKTKTIFICPHIKHRIIKDPSDLHGSHENNMNKATSMSRMQVKHDKISKKKKTIDCNGQESISTLIAQLKFVSKKKDLQEGTRIHGEILKGGLLVNNPFLGSTLVSMYAKCGALTKAEQILNEFHFQDVVSWNALISGYVQHGKGKEALKCFEQMKIRGVCADSVTFICILKACATLKDLDRGKQIHDEIVLTGLISADAFLGTSLVDMYAKCGALIEAQKIHKELPGRDVVSWNALIAGFAQNGQGKEAFNCFEQMQRESFSPDVVSFISVLKACGNTRDVEMGKRIHGEIVNKGLLGKYIALGTAMIDMYAKCGALTKAEKLFDEMAVRDVASWNALITGYAQHGHAKEALSGFHRMKSEGLSPNAITIISVLKACAITCSVAVGKEIHKEMHDLWLLRKDIMIGTALLDMYAKCGLLDIADEVFNELPVRDLICWNAIISGHAQQAKGRKALYFFSRMLQEGFSPDNITLISTLTACSSTGDVKKGKTIHGEIVWKGLLGINMILDTALIDMYAKCGALTWAEYLHHELNIQDVVSWNALIAGYIQHGHEREAFNSFEQMQREGVFPNVITYICILKACGDVGDVDKGQKIHDEIDSKGLLSKNVALGTALVDMYAKCGALGKAEELLTSLPIQNVVAWTAVVSGYAQQGQGEDAMKCFKKMCKEGVHPNPITFSCALKVCGSTVDVVQGKQIHEQLASNGLLEKDDVLGTALVDMYARFGAVLKAEEIFHQLSIRNTVSWNALITGYAQQGQSKEAISCFSHMQNDDATPDSVTFTSLLNACSHGGLVQEGELYFLQMSAKYGILPSLDHHTCMVDLYGRAGNFEKAMRVIKEMPSSDYPPIWNALLNACRKWGNVKLGRLAFDNVAQLDSKNDAAYILMANIYTAAGMSENMANIGTMWMKNVTDNCDIT